MYRPHGLKFTWVEKADNFVTATLRWFRVQNATSGLQGKSAGGGLLRNCRFDRRQKLRGGLEPVLSIRLEAALDAFRHFFWQRRPEVAPVGHLLLPHAQKQ